LTTKNKSSATATISEKPTKQVSDRMKKVKSKGSKIEQTMESLLKQLCLKYEKQPKMVAHPDFILRNEKIAIFCDSAFWHGKVSEKQNFKRNKLFWEQKIEANRQRDEKNNRVLSELGWKVLRFWDHNILKNSRFVAKTILTEVNPLPEKRLVAVELFCGAGGMSHGFFLEGIDVVAGFDVDKTCKYPYEKNNSATFIEKSVSEIDGEEIKKLYPEGSIKILAGCAPCQPFSSYTQKKKKDSDKWRLLYEFTRLIDYVLPDIITMENVSRLMSYDKGKVFGDFLENLKNRGYKIWYEMVKCPNYGIPQNRRRLVLLASLLGDITLIPKTHLPKEYLTVRDAIGELEPISAGGSSHKDALHRARDLSAKNLQRMMATPEGGSWRNWPEELVLECHKKDTGKSFGNIYGRMKWDEPSPTITTESIGIGSGRFGHPEQNRAISLREAALLQTFPSYYDFIDPSAVLSGKNIAVHIGNAVPVRLGQIIARSIKMHFRGMCGGSRKIQINDKFECS
jgi:DNA (cytosine-5)-methyltransferase 1